jgi:DNA repair exonuclease SbcCD ATPase subunit
MILFKKLRYKNILSAGNVFTEIDLNRSKTTLISGKNGGGKSTVLDALAFALYGKPFRKITKPQLVNSINQKELVVEVEFSIGQNSYKIVRGIKPNIFEIWKNNEMLNQDASARDYQAYLEENILKINFKSFNQIVVLGSATYVPFMELTAAARREVIEDLLDIQVFSTMNSILKDKVSENKQSIANCASDMNLIQSKIFMVMEHNDSITKMKLVEVDKIKKKMTDGIESIEQENAHVSAKQEQIQQLIETISDKASVKSKLEKFRNLMVELQGNKRKIENELSFYHNHDNCPTCKQGIEHDFKNEIVEESRVKVNEIDDAVAKIQEKIEAANTRLEEISKVEDAIQKHNLAMGEHLANIKIIKGSLKSFGAELENAEKEVEEVDKSKVEELKNERTELYAKQEKLHTEKETLSIASAILKDGGIKTRIVKQYVPVMNKLINKYLAAFELFVDFQLDENFNETIKSRFRDNFSYPSFSEGEKLRISLAILLTWRTISKMRNSVSTNLLIMDETLDGAIDATGIEKLIDTLNSLNTNDNIFVISHRGEQFGEKFESHIQFEKVKNFSRIAA